jgi:Bacterial PH domain
MAADELMTFRSTTAVIAWVVWLLFAAANWIDLAVQGRDKGSLIAAAALLLATGIAYVTAQRPRVIADDDGITVRNPFRDHRVGWPGVTRVDLADVLRVHCDWSGTQEPDGKKHRKIISAWAVHYSRRRQLATEAKARRAARRGASGQSAFGMPYGGGGRALPYASTAYAATGSAEEADAERTVRLLSERATAAPDGECQPPRSTWSGTALAAVLIPALILLVVCLV